MESISIIIPTHDRPACLRRLIDALLVQTVPPGEVIVVSDGETAPDASLLERLQAAGISTQLITRQQASSAAGRNAGLAAAKGDIVFCLDDDMVPSPDLLAQLRALYAADTNQQIAAIGVPYDDVGRTGSWRWWELAFCVLGRVRWRPRRQKSRYMQLPPSLSQQLTPAEMISGGAMSLRGSIARVARFDETFQGYAFGEDRELSYRLGRQHALYNTKQLRIPHAPAEGGRGDWRSRGRVYVENVLHVVHTSVDAGAGTTLMVAIDFAGAFVQHLLWAIVTRKRHNLDFSLGLLAAVCQQGGRILKETLCGH